MDSIINGLIKQDEKAYLETEKILVANYIVLRIQKGVGYITAINPMVSKDITAKDIWDALPDEYKDQSVPISFKDQEYILTWDFCEYIKREVTENGSQNSIR